jgi:dienelactone hydrolase
LSQPDVELSQPAHPPRPSAIAGYEDWPAYVQKHPRHQAASASAQELADALGVPGLSGVLGVPTVHGVPEAPHAPAAPPSPDVTIHWAQTYDGVTTSQLSWQLGFGPRTTGWLIRPAGDAGPLPGILALHCHGGNKFGGADRLVEFPESHPSAEKARTGHYDGHALATDIARRGFAVLAHDTFAWGSRRFNLDVPPWRTASALEARQAQWREDGIAASDADVYNAAAGFHEDTVAKTAGLLGTSLAGMVAHDDLAALEILAGLPDVDQDRLGCIGFSGGGGRSLTLAALSPRIRSYVVTCMMTTFQSLLPAHLDAHSWLLQTPGLWRLGDWPELTARSAASRLLVQYALADELFPEDGMRQAHTILESLHPPGTYTGSFWPGGHVFTSGMQEEALDFLAVTLHHPSSTAESSISFHSTSS